MLVATICVPYVFLFLEALAKSLFRNRRGPVFADLITVRASCKEGPVGISSVYRLDLPSREYSHVRRVSARISCPTKL